MTLLRTIAVAAALIAFGAGPARAQKNVDKAREIFRGGQTAYKAGQYKMAARAFEQALKLFPVPAIIFSTAQAHRLQYFIDKEPGRLKRAIELYRQYLAKVRKGGRRDDAAASLAELEPILTRLQASGASIRAVTMIEPVTQLMVSTQVQGAKAYIDGKPGTIPVIRKVAPGSHKIRVEAPGYFTEKRTATAVDGQFVSIEVKLRPKPAVVSLRVESGAQVSVDGRLAGTTPLARPLELTAGKHFISVTRRGRRPWSREVTVKRGQQMSVKVRLRKTTQRKLAFWVMMTAVVGYGLAGASGFAAFSADKEASDLEEQRQSEGLTPAERAIYVDARDRRDKHLSNSYLLAGAASAVALTSVLMYVLDTPRAEAPVGGFGQGSVAVTPLLDGDLAGMALMGRF